MQNIESNVIKNKENAILNHSFLTNNLIDYVGNKKESLLFLDKIISKIIAKNEELKEKKEQGKIITFFDVFSGSGAVSRYAKLKGFQVYANDVEKYARVLTEIPLCNTKEKVEHYFEFIVKKLPITIDPNKGCYEQTIDYLNSLTKPKYSKNKYFSNVFSPKETNNPINNERLYYSQENALKIDAIIECIFNNKIFSQEPREIILCSLFNEVLNRINNDKKLTRSFLPKFGKGNKELKSRVLADLELKPLVFLTKKELEEKNKKLLSPNYLCEVHQSFAETLFESEKCKKVFDFVYLDPPTSKQQYGFNYSHLNTIVENDKPILEDNKKFESRKDILDSFFCRKLKDRRNNKKLAEMALEKTFDSINAKYVLYSYTPNSILTIPEIINIFSKNGSNYIDIEYQVKERTLDDENTMSINNTNNIEHCLFIIQKNKRQYEEDIDFLIRELKSKAIMAENESFNINQKFIDIEKLVLENLKWHYTKNNIVKKYNLYHKQKFIFEVNFNNMIVSNIDTDFTTEEKEILSKYFVEENVHQVTNDNDVELVLPSYLLNNEKNSGKDGVNQSNVNIKKDVEIKGLDNVINGNDDSSNLDEEMTIVIPKKVEDSVKQQNNEVKNISDDIENMLSLLEMKIENRQNKIKEEKQNNETEINIQILSQSKNKESDDNDDVEFVFNR